MRLGGLCRKRRSFQFLRKGGYLFPLDDYVGRGEYIRAFEIRPFFPRFGVVFLDALDLVAEKVYADGISAVDGENFQNVAPQRKTPFRVDDLLAHVPHFHQLFHHVLRICGFALFQRDRIEPRGEELQQGFERGDGGAGSLLNFVKAVEPAEKRMFGQRFVI